MASFYVGKSAEFVFSELGNARFLYGLRRNDDGELFFQRIDLLTEFESIEINQPGDSNENFVNFEEGVDFLDGIDENHEKVFANLTYPQLRWDSKSAYYYVDPDDGQLVVRFNRSFNYPDDISS